MFQIQRQICGYHVVNNVKQQGHLIILQLTLIELHRHFQVKTLNQLVVVVVTQDNNDNI